MARQAAIAMPELVRQSGNMFTQRPVATDSTNTFKAGALVYLVAGILTLVPTAGVLVYGQTPDISHAATDIPPVAFFGENHYVFSPLDAEFEINVGALAANALVIGAAAQTPATAVLGTSYGIATATAGAYAGFQFLDTTNTTNLIFQVTGVPDGVLTDDQNGRVRVKVLTPKIQN